MRPQSRGMPFGAPIAGTVTWSMKTCRAASIVANCRSSFEPKWAKSPLLLMPSCSASEPTVSRSKPWAEAMSTARARMASRGRSPRAGGRGAGGLADVLPRARKCAGMGLLYHTTQIITNVRAMLLPLRYGHEKAYGTADNPFFRDAPWCGDFAWRCARAGDSAGAVRRAAGNRSAGRGAARVVSCGYGGDDNAESRVVRAGSGARRSCDFVDRHPGDEREGSDTLGVGRGPHDAGEAEIAGD